MYGEELLNFKRIVNIKGIILIIKDRNLFEG